MRSPAPIPLDYDADPERFRTNVRAASRFGVSAGIHGQVA
jgi:hypothetical protein